jgi:hypothetical protein
MATEVEVMVNNDGRVAIVIAALSAAPKSYKIVEPKLMAFELVCDDGSRPLMVFPDSAAEAWQIVIDNEELLCTEVNTESVDPVQDGIVRDVWLAPEPA